MECWCFDRAALGIVLCRLQMRGKIAAKTKRGPQKPFRVASAGLGDEKDMLMGQAEPERDEEQADNVDDIRNDEADGDEAGDEAVER